MSKATAVLAHIIRNGHEPITRQDKRDISARVGQNTLDGLLIEVDAIVNGAGAVRITKRMGEERIDLWIAPEDQGTTLAERFRLLVNGQYLNFAQIVALHDEVRS